MLRHANKLLLTTRAGCFSKHVAVARSQGRRSFVAATSREKRALNDQQLKGGAAPAAPAPPSVASAGSGGGGGGGTTLAVAATLAVAGGGAAYYFNMLPDSMKIPGLPKQTPKEEEVAVKADVVTTKIDGADSVVVTATEETVPGGEFKDAAMEVVSAEEEAPVAPGKVSSEPAPSTVAASGQPDVAAAVVSTHALEESKIMATLHELKAQLNAKTDKALSEAHRELAKLSSLNMNDLDTMTETQLKVRLVQMAKEMEEQAKWEAVRLQQFLALKEKEVEDKYVLVIKKLRREAEDLMDSKLAQQRKELQAQAEEDLKAQQESSDAFAESSLKIQEQQFEDERAAYEKKVEEAMNAKYEELFGKSLAEAKQAMVVKMEEKVKQMEALSKKLSDLEFALQSTKDFQAGSVQAHRITAAAIALSEKLDSGEAAGAAVNALKAVASENVVVSSAVDALPPSVTTTGLSTLQELQMRFEEEVYPQCRRATNIPDGQSGLEGQILGALFSTLKYPPAPDDPAPESEKDASEYVLSRARRHVQLGKLEEAVSEISKLKGQAAFVAKDWEGWAKDRVAVEKAMKVIHMELALANETLSNTPVIK